jgi:hypothetical protein
MELPDIGPVNEHIPVPEEFHSFEAGKPFNQCLACQKQLLEDGTLYFIEKAYQKDEVLFEYAICLECREAMQKEISESSQERVNAYFGSKVDLVARRQSLIEKHRLDHRPWIDRCILTGKSLKQSRQHQIITLCDGGDMLFSYLPYMISGEAMRELTELLSKQTKDRLDGFVDEFLGLPPGVRDLDLVLL